MPDTVPELDRVRPVYESLPGWRRSTAGARRLTDLPAEARRYLDRLEALAETPVRYVGVGTRREQLIEVP
jgi:adenylosuccinate synthase